MHARHILATGMRRLNVRDDLIEMHRSRILHQSAFRRRLDDFLRTSDPA